MESNQQYTDESSSLFTRIKNKILPGVKIGLLLSIIIYISMIIVGDLGLKQCPVNDNIPLFLILIGAIGLISKLSTLVKDKLENNFNFKYLNFVLSALYIVELVVFVLGSYWVFKEFQPNYDPRSGKLYCKKSVYLFAFIYLAVVYAILLSTLAGFLCVMLSAVFLSSRSERDPEAAN